MGRYLGEEIRKLGFGMMRLPRKGDEIDIYYDPKKPEKYACYAFGPAEKPIGW